MTYYIWSVKILTICSILDTFLSFRKIDIFRTSKTITIWNLQAIFIFTLQMSFLVYFFLKLKVFRRASSPFSLTDWEDSDPFECFLLSICTHVFINAWALLLIDLLKNLLLKPPFKLELSMTLVSIAHFKSISSLVVNFRRNFCG